MSEENLAACWSKLTKGERALLMKVVGRFMDNDVNPATLLLSNARDAVVLMLKQERQHTIVASNFDHTTTVKRKQQYMARKCRNIARKIESCLTSSSTGNLSRRRIRNVSLEP